MKITVADIVAHFQKYPPDAEVHLDHDGWMEDECSNPADAATIIKERGLFLERLRDDDPVIIINN